MNKRVLGGAIVLAAVAALITSGKLRSIVLPDGTFTTDKKLSESLDVTPEPIPGRPQVELSTSKGKITMELRPDLAPQSVANFLAKWNSGYCAGKTFHRVEDWVVQGCDPEGDGTGGNLSLPTETSSESFVAGSVGVARRVSPKDKSNDSQFFIVKKDATSLNGEYTYLGKVVAGMDIVNALGVGDTITGAAVLSK